MNGRTLEDVRTLLLVGGSVRMNTADRSDEEMGILALAAASAQAKPRWELYNLAGRSTEVLRQIAIAGRGAVLFSDETGS